MKLNMLGLEKFKNLIPDIEDYINEYEKEYGISKI